MAPIVAACLSLTHQAPAGGCSVIESALPSASSSFTPASPKISTAVLFLVGLAPISSSTLLVSWSPEKLPSGCLVFMIVMARSLGAMV